MKKNVFFVVLLLAGVFFMRFFLHTVAASPGSSTATQDEPATTSPSSAGTLYLAFLSKSSLVYFDDFSDPHSGWPVNDSGSVLRRYENGVYVISIQQQNLWGGSVPALADIADYSVAVDIGVDTDTSGFYGLIFDRIDWDRFYVFVISPDTQLYGVLRHDPANWELLVPFTSSSAIHTGTANNYLRVERTGENVSVYVNDQALASLVDNVYASFSNEVGLFAQSDVNIPATVRFDNFTILSLGASDAHKMNALPVTTSKLSTDSFTPFSVSP